MSAVPVPDLRGRWAVVTGASRGIGLGVARALAGCGANVAMVARDREVLEGAGAEVRAVAPAGTEVTSLVADVGDPEGIEGLFARLDAELPRIDVFVANAGSGRPVPFLEITRDDWDRTLGLNLTGTFLCCQAAARRMVASPGIDPSITVMSSIRATGTRAGLTHYATSKAGINQLVRSASLELAPHGVRVNAVSPGLTRTPLATLDEAHFARREADIPFGRAVTTDEVGAAVVYLVGPGARSVTGANLVVDGGESVR